MNNDRRKALRKLAEELSTVIGQLDDIKSQLEDLRDEEQEYYDNMPESLQGGDKGQAAEAAVSNLDEAISALDEFTGSTDIADYIESACE